MNTHKSQQKTEREREGDPFIYAYLLFIHLCGYIRIHTIHKFSEVCLPRCLHVSMYVYVHVG